LLLLNPSLFAIAASTVASKSNGPKCKRDRKAQKEREERVLDKIERHESLLTSMPLTARPMSNIIIEDLEENTMAMKERRREKLEQKEKKRYGLRYR